MTLIKYIREQFVQQNSALVKVLFVNKYMEIDCILMISTIFVTSTKATRNVAKTISDLMYFKLASCDKCWT